MSLVEFLPSKRFDSAIWSTTISSNSNELILDVRDEKKQVVQYFKLNLETLKSELFEIKNALWWSNLEAYDGSLYISEYQDKNNPNNKKFYKYINDDKIEVGVEDIPLSREMVHHPFLYEPDTEYFKSVSTFLGLDLPCSCEYLEIEGKIILSYYLRSGKELDRYLLIIDDGKKVLKEVQDSGMKGFALGAFFVIENRVVFVKNRNEICIYTV